MREITVAATQIACSWDRSANVEKASNLVRREAERGANVILLQELFETACFCTEQRHQHLELASPRSDNP